MSHKLIQRENSGNLRLCYILRIFKKYLHVESFEKSTIYICFEESEMSTSSYLKSPSNVGLYWGVLFCCWVAILVDFLFFTLPIGICMVAWFSVLLWLCKLFQLKKNLWEDKILWRFDSLLILLLFLLYLHVKNVMHHILFIIYSLSLLL